jgi:hypothetical protein
MFVPTDRTSLRFAARITIAAMTAYLVALALELPEVLWAVITGIIVTQMSVGSTIGIGLDRLVGTLAGALVGGVAATVHAVWPVLPVGVLLLVSVAPLSLFVVKRPTYRVAPVTAALMLLLVHEQGTRPLALAFDRVLEIAISLLVLPYRAEQLLVDRVASGLRLLAELVVVQLGARAPADLARIDALNERVRTLLAGCETTALDVQREHRMHLGGRRDPEPLFRTLRRLRSDVAILDRAMSQLVADDAAPPMLAPLAQAIAGWLEQAAGTLAGRKAPPPLDPVDGAIADGFGGSQVPERLLPLWFAVEALRRDCGDLHDRMAERAAEVRQVILPGT